MPGHWQDGFSNCHTQKKIERKESVLNLASPELDSTDVRLQRGACKTSTLTTVRAERQLQKASPSQNVISKRSFYHMIYLYCFSMVQSFLIHMQNPEKEEKKTRKKTLRPKSQEPCWGQGNGLVVFEGCLKPSK